MFCGRCSWKRLVVIWESSVGEEVVLGSPLRVRKQDQGPVLELEMIVFWYNIVLWGWCLSLGWALLNLSLCWDLFVPPLRLVWTIIEWTNQWIIGWVLHFVVLEKNNRLYCTICYYTIIYKNHLTFAHSWHFPVDCGWRFGGKSPEPPGCTAQFE